MVQATSPRYLALRNKNKKEQVYWLNELRAHVRAYCRFFGFSIEWRKGRARYGIYMREASSLSKAGEVIFSITIID